MDVSAIVMGDPTTNYQLIPGDRLMVYRIPEVPARCGWAKPRAGANDPGQVR